MARAAIVYVGTDDGLVLFSNPGTTKKWFRGATELQGKTILVILAVDDQTLLIVPRDGKPLLSSDGAQTWAPAPDEDAQKAEELLQTKDKLLQTAQGPTFWRGTQEPAPGAGPLALLAGKNEVLLTAIAEGTSLLRSEDNGANWNKASLNDELQGSITTIVPTSFHIDYVWAGTDAGQLLQSTDRGRSWSEVAQVGSPIRSLAAVQLASAS